MDTPWAPEIEKKYRLKTTADATNIVKKAYSLGLIEESYALQKDWTPDFSDYAMKQAGVLLRIRTIKYLTGSGPLWVITLKVRRTENGIHHNLELEASSEDDKNIPGIITFIQDTFGTIIDLKKLVALGKNYATEIGLTKRRIYMEKRRRQYHDRDHEITLAIDELPEPAGWFAEIELGKATAFSDWEPRLGLNDASVETRSYGEVVKQVTLDNYGEEHRELSFSDSNEHKPME